MVLGDSRGQMLTSEGRKKVRVLAVQSQGAVMARTLLEDKGLSW